MSGVLHAQVVAAGQGARTWWAEASSPRIGPDYGPNELRGWGGFLDFNLRGHLGVEGKYVFSASTRLTTCTKITTSWVPGTGGVSAVGTVGKFMIGNGQFNFPFSYGHGGYLMLVPGGGLDIHYHRFTIRAVDYEYQHWTNFQNSSLSPNGFSTGIAYRIF